MAAVLISVFAYVKLGEYWLRSDPAWAEYVRYNSARSIIGDYNGLLAYEDNEDAYRKIGVSKLELEMVEAWVTENTDSFTTEKVAELAALSNVQIG